MLYYLHMRGLKKRRQHFKILDKPIFVFGLLAMVALPLAFVIMDREMKAIAETPSCKATTISSTSFVRTEHLRDGTYGYGILPTRDGGYVLTGDTQWVKAMSVPNPYAIKMDAKGKAQWSQQYSSQSNALGYMSSRHIGRLAVETSDGSIITASDVIDFVDEDRREIYGDILVTKLNSKGAQQWSTMLGDQSIDRPQKMWALPDGGVLLLARVMEAGHGSEVADTSAVPTFSVLIKLDKNGKVLSSKKMDWDALDMQRLSDGSFIALANVKVITAPQAENIIGPEVAMHPLPTMIRLNSSYKTVWAKSLEMIPSELNTVSSITETGFTMGKTKIRLAGGDFMAIQQTSDGGFMAFGYDNILLTQGMSGSVGAITQFTPRALSAVKVDAAGNYKWAKKLTPELSSSVSAIDLHVVKTTDNDFVLMQDVIHDANWKAESGAQALKQAWASNIALFKVDPNFNPRWIKQIEAEKDIKGYAIQPTADKSVVVAGEMITTKERLVLGSMEPYVEAIVIKVDVNGNVNKGAAVSDQSKATVVDQSSYLVMQDMSIAAASDFKLPINKSVKEKVWTIKNTERDICAYAKVSTIPICSFINSNTNTGGSGGTPVAKSWAQINYDNAKEAKIESAKNQGINDELLPILKQVFGQVKLKDSMNSMWLTYYFPRLVTRADVEAVQKKYEALGYKVDESEGGTLFVSRVGLTLHMTFSINSSMTGKVEVLF